MPITRVMAVVRGDPSDDNAVTHAADLVRPHKGKLYVLYVIRMGRGLPVDAESPDEVRRGEEALLHAERLARIARGDLEAHLVQAREFGHAVVHEAVVREVDAIVIGTPYPMEFGDFSLGEDLLYVLQHAPCTVLLWREPPKDWLVDGRSPRTLKPGVRQSPPAGPRPE